MRLVFTIGQDQAAAPGQIAECVTSWPIRRACVHRLLRYHGHFLTPNCLKNATSQLWGIFIHRLHYDIKRRTSDVSKPLKTNRRAKKCDAQIISFCVWHSRKAVKATTCEIPSWSQKIKTKSKTEATNMSIFDCNHFWEIHRSLSDNFQTFCNFFVDFCSESRSAKSREHSFQF